MEPLEELILRSLEEKKADELLKFLGGRVAEECAEEIDSVVARFSLYSRSVSSSSGTNSSIIEKRVIQRRLRSTADAVANTAKFKTFKKRILKQVDFIVCSKNDSCNGRRPTTGFESLFSVDDLSEEDETLLFSGLSLSQSMRLPGDEDLNRIIRLCGDREASKTERLEAFHKLSSMSVAIFSRSEAFESLLQNAAVVSEDSELLYEFLFLLGRIANLQNSDSFFKVLQCLVSIKDEIISKKSFTEKIKFVDLLKQLFLFLPRILRRETSEDIKLMMNEFVRCFATTDDDFISIYSILDPTATVFTEIFHFYSLRFPISEQFPEFLKTCFRIILADPESNNENKKTFTCSVVLISFKYPDLTDGFISATDPDFIQSGFYSILTTGFRRSAKKTTISKFQKYLEKKLMDSAGNLKFAKTMIRIISSIDPSTWRFKNINLNNFGKFLSICLNSLPAYCSQEEIPIIVYQIIQLLILSKKKQNFLTAVTVINVVMDRSSKLSEFVFISPYSSLLIQNLNPGDKIHSKILFHSGLSNSKNVWRKFRPKSIFESPFLNLIQHPVILTSEDKKTALRWILQYLTEDEASVDFLEFLQKTPDALVEIFKGFELESFFVEEFNKETQKKSGKFLTKFSNLVQNLDFLIECRTRLNLPNTVIKALNRYCRNSQGKLIVDEFSVSCLNLISKTTIGSSGEVVNCEFIGEDPELTTSPTPQTIRWMNPIFDYAVYLKKVSTKSFAHRNAVQLKLPYIENERNDFFTGVIFLMTGCNPKFTNFLLSFLASENKNSIKMIWSLKFDSNFEFLHFLRENIWFFFRQKIQKKKKFIDLVDFCYRCGIGKIDFDLVEKLVLTAIYGETEDVVDLFLSQ